MTAEPRLERDLPFILDEIVVGPYPDYIDDVLSTTARRRQRPSWAFPGRWLPVEIATTRVPTTRLPWRQLGVLALLAVLIGTMIAVYVGTRAPKLPAPFGPADNGLVALQRDGDLYVVDPQTGQEILLDARRVLTFKPSLVLKNLLNGEEPPPAGSEDEDDDD